jgi:hypothetical protein
MRLLPFQNKRLFLKGLSLGRTLPYDCGDRDSGDHHRLGGHSRRGKRKGSETGKRRQHSDAAIKLYISNGGSTRHPDRTGPYSQKLKSTRSKADKELHVGAPSGRMIDARVSTIAIADGDDGLPSQPTMRQKHDSTSPSSGAGVRFILDNNLAEVASDVESRSHGAVNYAQSSTWVWDNAGASNPNAPQGPNTFTTNPTVADTTPERL